MGQIRTMEALVKEIRQVSWGAAIAVSAVGDHQSGGISLLLGGGAWLILLVIAILLESSKNEGGV